LPLGGAGLHVQHPPRRLVASFSSNQDPAKLRMEKKGRAKKTVTVVAGHARNGAFLK
jgi:hypothetical protein